MIPLASSKNARVPIKALVLVQFIFPSIKAKVPPNTPLDTSKELSLFSTVYVWVRSLPKMGKKKKKKNRASKGISQRFGLLW